MANEPTYLPINLPPGLANNGTAYQTKGRWHDGNLVRFFQGNKQPIGGWSQRTLTGATILGIPTSAVSWMRLDGTPILVVATKQTSGGTPIHFYAIDSSNFVTDLTIGGAGWPGDRAHLTVFGGFLMAVLPIGLTGSAVPLFWDGNISHNITGFGSRTGNSGPIGMVDMFTTPEYFLVTLGAGDGQAVVTPTTSPDPRLVWWASQATYDPSTVANNWFPQVTNSAGSFELQTKGNLICGAPARGLSLIWSTVDLWAMTYIGGNLIYRFDKVGDGCGIISRDAKVVLDNSVLWMGTSRFFSYNGFVQPLPCDVQDYIFTPTATTGVNQTYANLIWALHNPGFNEVTWFYVAGSSNSAINAYVTYNYVENHWTYGTLARTAGVPFQQPGTVPVLFDASGNLYDHETGNARTGITAYLESGPVEIGNGDNIYSITHFVPDDKTLGDVLLKVYTSYYPDNSEILNGPYALASPTSVRLKARQMRLRLEEVNATGWRVGNLRIRATLGSKR